MHNRPMLSLLFLLSVAWLQANPAAEKKASGVTTIDGCLSSSQGNYILTENDGTTHTLSGYANKLGKQVNREIEVTGKPSIGTVGMTPLGGASAAAEIPVFEVKTVTRVADTCKAK